MTAISLPNSRNIERVTLPNGVTILIYNNPQVDSFVVRGSLPAGSARDAADRAGVASMTAALLLSGTHSRDFDTLNGALEDIGAELDFDTSHFRVTFTARALSEDLPTLIDILADALQHPTFPPEEVQEERAKRLTELRFGMQNTRYMAARTFRRTLYPPRHPFYHSVYGTLDSLPQITSDDLHAFHRAHYGPQGMIITVAGAVDAETVVRVIDAALGDWQNPRQASLPPVEPIPAPTELQRVDTYIPAKAQSDIVMGTIGPEQHAPDYYPAALANSILGEFGLMGRVGLVIREELGLAYYVYSRLEGGQAQGAWHITAGVAPDDVDITIEQLREQVRRLCTEPVSPQELDDNQSYFTGRVPLRLESNLGLASVIHRLERYQLGLDYLLSYRERIYQPTPADILRVAQTYLDPDRLVIAVAGS